MKRSSTILAAAGAAGIVQFFPVLAKAQAVAIYATHYVGGDGGSWNDESLWLNDVTGNPQAPSSTANVTINNGHAPILNGGQILSLNIQPGSGLTFNSATLEILGMPGLERANFVPGGTITLNGASVIDYHSADAAAHPIYYNAGGTIIANSDTAKIIGTIRNTNTTFRGGGYYGNAGSQGSYFIQNSGGTFNADTAGLTMTLQPGILSDSVYLQTGGGGGVYSGLSNVGGTVKATNGGHLVLAGGLNGFDLRGGTFAVDGAGSVVSFRGNAVVVADTLNSTNGGIFRVDSGEGAYVNATFASNTRLTVADQGSLYIIPYDFTNDGIITVGSSTTTALTQINSGTGYGYGPSTTFNGTGQVVLASDFSEINSSGGTLTNGSSHTIHGFGKIQGGGYDFVNNGLVSADQAGKTLTTLRLTNNGIVEATNGGTLYRASFDTYQAGGGTLRATGTGSKVLLTGGTVRSGTLATSGGGVIQIGDSNTSGYQIASFENVASTADIRIIGHGGLNLSGTYTDNGSVTVAPNDTGYSTTTIGLADGLTIGGSGSFVLQTNSTGTSGISGSGTITHAAGHTIRGAGQVIVYGTLNNGGTVGADSAGQTLSLFANNFSNTGTVRAESGGTFYGQTLPTNYAAGVLTGGTWDARANSTIRIDGMNVTANNATIVLDGAGSAFTSDATGTSALAGLTANGGSLTIRNGRNLSTSGPLANTGSLIVGDNSKLTVGGVLTNTGTLSGTGTIAATSVVAGGTLAPGASPGTLTVDGNFAVASGAAYNWEISSTAHDLIDVNGTLSFGALATLNVSQYGAAAPVAGIYDLFTYDGTTPILPAWTINLPQGWASSGVSASNGAVYLTLTAVPEPGSLAWLAVGGTAMLRRRQKMTNPRV